MAELREIFKVEGYKRVLLHANGFKSIYPVRRENPGLSDSEIYEQLLKNWNELVDTVENIDKRRKQEKEQRRKEREQRQAFFKDEIEHLGQAVKIVKPIINKNIKKFKMVKFEMQYTNNDPNNTGLKSLNLINYTINTLRKTVKEHPIKINFTLELSFVRLDEKTIILTSTPPKTITTSTLHKHANRTN
jgi:hypothetical protein